MQSSVVRPSRSVHVAEMHADCSAGFDHLKITVAIQSAQFERKMRVAVTSGPPAGHRLACDVECVEIR